MYFATAKLNSSEPCIIQGFSNEALIIRDLDDNEIATILPTSGPWTHEKLVSLDLTLFQEVIAEGANAFLGVQWIGSTEC